MNYWTKQSIEFAQQKNYLDELFKVYPLNPNLRRELSQQQTGKIYRVYDERDNVLLVETLLQSEIFPLKDSYVPFLRHDRQALLRNPQTVNRIAGNLYQMGIEAVLERCTAPKETNRQMGPLFKNWLQRGILGVPVLNSPDEFMKCESNCVLNASGEVIKSTKFEDALNTMQSFRKTNNHVNDRAYI